MKLGILIPHFPTQTHVFFWREIQALERQGVDVAILSTRKARRTDCPHDFFDEATARTHYVAPPGAGAVLARTIGSAVGVARSCRYVAGLSDSGWKGKARAAFYALCAADLADHSRREGIAHIHAHSCAEAAHVVAMSRLWGGPSYSLHLHGDLPVYGVDHASKMKQAAFISADAKPMQQEVVAKIGVPRDATYTIWMGVDTERSRPPDARITDGSVKMVTVGRLHLCKGHRHALAAMRTAIDTGADLRYLIAGSGPHRAGIVKDVERLGLADRVEFLGSLGEDEVIKLLQSADIFVLPSVGIGEASPVSVMEAMSCGVAVISSVIGGTPDMITDGADGILVQQGDEKDLAAALVRLVRNPEERRRLGEAARKRAVVAFDVGVTARRLLATIEAHVGLAFTDEKRSSGQAERTAAAAL